MTKQNRDIPLGGPTSVTDTTNYRRKGTYILPSPTPSNPLPPSQKRNEKKDSESKKSLNKVRRDLDKDFTKPLNPKSK